MTIETRLMATGHFGYLDTQLLRRRLITVAQTNEINQKYANATAVLSTIMDNANVYDFEYMMQGVPGSGSIGIHGGGHYAIGGDPGRGKPVQVLENTCTRREHLQRSMRSSEADVVDGGQISSCLLATLCSICTTE